VGADLQPFLGTASNPGMSIVPVAPWGFCGHKGRQQEAGGSCATASAPLGFQPWPGWAGRAVGNALASPGASDTPGLAPLRGGEEEGPVKIKLNLDFW